VTSSLSAAPRAPGNPPDAARDRIAELVTRLDSLLEGADAAARLVACGAAAVGPLRAFLLEGRPSGVFQRRLWAVQALGGLGADDVLIDFLSASPPADPIARFGEEVVRGAAARALTESGHPEAQGILQEVARRERLPAALEAIATRSPAASIPILVEALEEDFARDAAAAALRKCGAVACEALTEAALDRGNDSQRARRRRRAALELLLDIGIDLPTWQRIDCLLDDEDVEIVCTVSRLGLLTSLDPARIAQRLIAILPQVGWDWLESLEDIAVQAIGRAGSSFSRGLLLESVNSHRPDVQMAWNRIRRRIV
jgi:hypothetical protein